MCMALMGCGLHGSRAQFVAIEGEHFIFKDWAGRELRLKDDERTRKEPDLKPGDEVQLYYTDDGVVKFIVKP
jgi:hypothetical protein